MNASVLGQKHKVVDRPDADAADAWGSAMQEQLQSEILPKYLPSRRWFGRKAGQISEVRIQHALPLGEIPNARLLIVEVIFSEGPPESYTLILARLDGIEAARMRIESPAAIIALLDADTVLCDGLFLPEVRAKLLEATASPSLSPSGPRLEGNSGQSLLEADARSFSGNSRLLTADHSNTAIAFADRWFFKLYRKFECGTNPDVSLTQILSEQHQLEFVPRFAGSLSIVEGAQSGAIGLMVEIIRHQGDGWVHTLTELSEYYGRVRAAGRALSEETSHELIGQIYPAQAHHLGRRTAQMHCALASTENNPDFAPEPFTRDDQESLCRAVWNSASDSVRQLQGKAAGLSAELRGDIADLIRNQGRLVSICERLQAGEINGQKVRVHGDYHLGQVLKTPGDFVVIDFEGEPCRTLAERTRKRSPLVDVAGMLRSFDYAAAAALAQEGESVRAPMATWAEAWVREISAAFLAGYLESARGATYLPQRSADGRLLLEVLLLEKAIYEIGYELNYRPDMLAIPLRAVCQIIDKPAQLLSAWN